MTKVLNHSHNFVMVLDIAQTNAAEMAVTDTTKTFNIAAKTTAAGRFLKPWTKNMTFTSTKP